MSSKKRDFKSNVSQYSIHSILHIILYAQYTTHNFLSTVSYTKYSMQRGRSHQTNILNESVQVINLISDHLYLQRVPPQLQQVMYQCCPPDKLRNFALLYHVLHLAEAEVLQVCVDILCNPIQILTIRSSGGQPAKLSKEPDT